MPRKPAAVIAFAATLIIVAQPACAQELFRNPSGSPGVVERELLDDDPLIARSRVAALDESLGLGDLAPRVLRSVVLNLFEDVELEATLERMPSQAPGSVFLAGRLSGGGHLTLYVTQEGIVSGEVHAREGVYTVRSVRGQAGHGRDVIVREIDTSKLSPMQCTTAPRLDFRRRPATAGQSGTALARSPTSGFLPGVRGREGIQVPASRDETVDVLVAYALYGDSAPTTSFRTGMDLDEEEIEAFIWADVERTNLAFSNSGLDRRINLVAMKRTDDVPDSAVEPGGPLEGGGVLNALIPGRNSGGDPAGFFDDLRDLRRRHGADVVYIFLVGPPPGGSAGGFFLRAARWVETYCAGSSNIDHCIKQVRGQHWAGLAVGNSQVAAISGFTFTHELGHVFGLRHDRYIEINDDYRALSLDDPPSFPITPYGFGYVNQNFDRDNCRGTIMAYPNQCYDETGFYSGQEPMFSNPDLEFGSEGEGFDPAGIPGDEWTVDLDGPADAARHLDEVWDVVAGLRDSRTALTTSVWDRESFDLLEYFDALDAEDGHVFTVESSNPQVAFSRVRAEDGNVHLDTVGLAPGMTIITVSAEAPDGGMSLERFSLTVEGPVLVPLFPAADTPAYEGFVRIINHSVTPRTVTIRAYDDDNREHGPVVMEIGDNQAAHFNSRDLEQGNPGKGLTGSTGSGQGDWRLEIESDNPRLEVLPYVRTRDGFVTTMYDRAPMEALNELGIPIFNPASNADQVSSLRLVNPQGEAVEVSISGIDDDGAMSVEPAVVTLPAGAARTLTSRELESGVSPDIDSGALGDGTGKWRLVVSANSPVVAMSLLESPTGHLSNLTGRAAPMGDYFRLDDVGADDPTFMAPFFPPHGDVKGRQGFVRVTNRSDEAVDVSIRATDILAAVEHGDLSLRVGPGQSRHFNSEDLESGNPEKGLTGSTGPWVGGRVGVTGEVSPDGWRLMLTAPPDVDVMSYVRTPGGFLTSMHDVLPFEANFVDFNYRSAFFNPASNGDQVSVLYAANLNEFDFSGLLVYGFDDANDSNRERVSINLGSLGRTRMVTSQSLEDGSANPWTVQHQRYGIGDGAGKWQLIIYSYRIAGLDGQRLYSGEVVPPVVMSLLENPTGHITNLSKQDLCTRGMTVLGCPNQ